MFRNAVPDFLTCPQLRSGYAGETYVQEFGAIISEMSCRPKGCMHTRGGFLLMAGFALAGDGLVLSSGQVPTLMWAAGC